MDGQPGCEEFLSYDITFAREFRYDSGRQRYLNRELDPQNLEGGVYTVMNETWSDYDGDDIYGDFSIDAAGLATDLRSYESGIANIDPWTETGEVDTTYLHSNHLGTLRETTGASTPSLRVFTAFGEAITSQGDRYGYVGAFGYQNDSEFPYLHVGARYYDPSTGRFLQRDPIGIKGGTNVYVYMFNSPTAGIDPTGNGFWGDLWTGIKIVGGAVSGIVGGVLIVSTSPAWVTAVGVGLVVVAVIAEVSAIRDIWPTGEKVVKPIEKPVRRRNRAVDDAIGCAGLGMEDN